MIGGLVLVALVLVLGLSERDRLWSIVATAGLAIAWLLFNGRMEGPVLIAFTGEDGLTLADLTGLAALGLAGWRWWRLRGPQDWAGALAWVKTKLFT